MVGGNGLLEPNCPSDAPGVGGVCFSARCLGKEIGPMSLSARGRLIFHAVAGEEIISLNLSAPAMRLGSGAFDFPTGDGSILVSKKVGTFSCVKSTALRRAAAFRANDKKVSAG